MGRELQKRKRRSSRPATKQPSSTRSKLTNPLGNSIVAKNWNKKETTMQNYRRLGLVSRLRAPTGGVEPKLRAGALPSSSSSSSGGTSDPFAIHGMRGKAGAAATTEVRVERDESGRITRVVRPDERRGRPNPLNDPLVELDTDSEAEGDDGAGEEAEEWGGFGAGGGGDDDEQNEIIRQLEGEANRPVVKKPRAASTREADWLQALVDRHGDDTAAMARDAKLNPMQQTGADIAKRLRKWKKGGVA
ncbi:putative nucleolar protein 16 [Rosellinia necatrix]|uniref:Nucleolar protein 16 n=1 Tax=Rosellinia necatrix TaxID=77044 RepID=A0A1S7ULI9_ROSNE|nr:putative nucleolar protein 16 [Rosellinia necatrix]